MINKNSNNSKDIDFKGELSCPKFDLSSDEEIIDAEKKCIIYKKNLRNTTSNNPNSNSNGKIQYVKLNFLLELILFRKEYAFYKLGEDYDTNMLTYFFIFYHSTFISTNTLLQKIFSMLETKSKLKSKKLLS